MTYLATVTSKGQVTVPVEIRRLLGIEPSSRVVFERQDDVVVMKPVVDFLALKGSVKPKRRLSEKQVDNQVAEFVAGEYESKTS